MKQTEKTEERNGIRGTTRRIVVSDEAPIPQPGSHGRRLESPPDSRTLDAPKIHANSQAPTRIRKSFLIAGTGACVVLVLVVTVLILKQRVPTKVEPQVKNESPPIVQTSVVSDQSDELRRIEEDAKQVLRRISRDNKPYSFSENAVKDIQSRVIELSRSPNISASLSRLQPNAASLGSQAGKVGLQPSLVMLLGLALAEGRQTADAFTAANRALPQLASLNKTFGSSEADSCLILIAAFQEGPGTQRSHPLLRRMNRSVTNPLTERNIWYLNDQNVISPEAYALVVDTIAYGVIARNPRQFGIQSDPLSF